MSSLHDKSYSFYLRGQAYLLVADLKLLKELMINATEHFSTSDEVSAMSHYSYGIIISPYSP